MAGTGIYSGLLYALVGPSAVGKNTLMKAALAHFDNLKQLPTATTRPPREGEAEGREHYFVTREQFEGLIEQKALVEWQVVHGELYGIPRRAVEDHFNQGIDLIADIEILGAAVLRKEYPQNAVLIFVTPPDKPALEKRIRARGGVKEEEIVRRLQRADFEMPFVSHSDYLVINDDLEQASQELLGIIYAEQSRRDLMGLTASVLIPNDEGQVLVESDFTGETSLLPHAPISPGESSSEVVLRLVEATGAGDVSFCCPAGTEIDETIVPAYFDMLMDGGRKRLNLVFLCEPISSGTKLRPGWRWESIERLSLAQTVLANMQKIPVKNS